MMIGIQITIMRVACVLLPFVLGFLRGFCVVFLGLFVLCSSKGRSVLCFPRVYVVSASLRVVCALLP